MRKIHGRPLLPWWVYVGYFLFGLIAALFGSPAGGEDMKPATGNAAKKATKGRYGDTELVHVNPFEKAILKALGGAGTTNPQTGLQEFYDPSDPFGGTGYTGGGGGFYSVNDTTPSTSLGGGGYTTGTGGQPTGPSTPSFNEGGYTGPGYSPEKGSGFNFEGPSNDFSETPGLAPSGPPSGSSLGSLNPINRLNDPKTAGSTLAGLLGGTGIGTLAGLMERLNWDRFGGNARADVDLNVGGMDNSPMGDAIAGALGAQPAVQTPDFMRPAPQEAPAYLGMGGGMTDLQKRAQIATGGTQGNTGLYRTPEAMRFYGNLIARALIGDNNKLAQQNANLLPIEDAYLKQAFGVSPKNNAEVVLAALKPYWSS